MKTSLQAILEVEEQARSLISDAEKQADAIRAEAQARSDEIVNRAKSDAETESDALVKRFQTEIEHAKTDSEETLKKETAELQEKYNANKERAIELVLQAIGHG
jgi:F0F1-type ATP synthase membrane subunit b/b'